MKVLVAMDSFKGSATSVQLNRHIKKGLKKAGDFEVEEISLSDGGEGSLDAITQLLDAKEVYVRTVDALKTPITSVYLIAEIDGKLTAIVESAKCLGIELHEVNEENFIKGSSYGLGLVLKDALSHNVSQIIITLGGTATADAGLGMLEALGYHVKRKGKKGNKLFDFQSISMDRQTVTFEHVKLLGATDVTSTMIASHNSFIQFNKQKGSTLELDKALLHSAFDLVQYYRHQYGLNVEETEGSGAAGGLGSSLLFLKGELISGFDFIAEVTDLESKIEQSDWIITGEGKIDGQTQHGKVPYAVVNLASLYNKPVTAFCGSYTHEALDKLEGFTGVFSIVSGPTDLKTSMERSLTLINIENLAFSLGKILRKNYENVVLNTRD